MLGVAQRTVVLAGMRNRCMQCAHVGMSADGHVYCLRGIELVSSLKSTELVSSPTRVVRWDAIPMQRYGL